MSEETRHELSSMELAPRVFPVDRVAFQRIFRDWCGDEAYESTLKHSSRGALGFYSGSGEIIVIDTDLGYWDELSDEQKAKGIKLFSEDGLSVEESAAKAWEYAWGARMTSSLTEEIIHYAQNKRLPWPVREVLARYYMYQLLEGRTAWDKQSEVPKCVAFCEHLTGAYGEGALHGLNFGTLDIPSLEDHLTKLIFDAAPSLFPDNQYGYQDEQTPDETLTF